MTSPEAPGPGAATGRPAPVVLVPDLLYRGDGFEAGLAVEYDPEDGRVLRVDLEEVLATAGGTERLPGRALLPGFVNAHSHAFQRVLRGRTQWRPASGEEADFWSWRKEMYRAVGSLDPEEIHLVSLFCFVEMLRAGFTSVGEFHYLHRDPGGAPYANPEELEERVIAAAREAGIRIVLLDTCYATGGIGRPLEAEQARFATPELEGFMAGVKRLLRRADSEPLVTVGVAPHSVRAVPREWLAPLWRWSGDAGLPFHIHLSEQPAEVAACREAYGLGPGELLEEEGILGRRLTVVHGTHLSAAEVRALGGAGATVCVCPTTERDLGDGVPPATELLEAGAGFALGSDSQTVIDPFEEMRSLEYHERLRSLGRVVLASEAGGRARAAPLLLDAATRGGAASLGLSAGRVEPGSWADFVAVDLDHHALAGWTAETLPDVLVFSAPVDVVTDVWVGGVRRVRDRAHALERKAADRFRQVAGRLRGGASGSS